MRGQKVNPGQIPQSADTTTKAPGRYHYKDSATGCSQPEEAELQHKAREDSAPPCSMKKLQNRGLLRFSKRPLLHPKSKLKNNPPGHYTRNLKALS